MGVPALQTPLTLPHRRSASAGANNNPEKEVEAMLPKDVLKYAEKVENIEEAILKELENKEKWDRKPSLGSWPPLQAGAFTPASQAQTWAQQQLLAQQQRQQNSLLWRVGKRAL
jgi:hypothetical protein